MESLAFSVHFLQHYNSNSLKKPFTCQLSCLLGDFAAWTLMTPSKHEILQNFLIIWCAFWFHFLDNKWIFFIYFKVSWLHFQGASKESITWLQCVSDDQRHWGKCLILPTQGHTLQCYGKVSVSDRQVELN